MKLEQAGIETPAVDARSLIAFALSCDRLQLLTDKDRLLREEEIASIDAIILRRAAREPVARIKGSREFWGLDFTLNEATLDPRPDSETLIETALSLKEQPTHILDLGTGSGCLLLSLLHEFQTASGLGIDQSSRAIDQAQKNATLLNLSSRATFIQSDWFEKVTGKFDLIISNPPYISSADIETLEPEVKQHDPLAALDGGPQGLDPYKIIIPHARDYLTQMGSLLFEVGINQSADIAALLKEYNFSVSIHKDLNGIERCVMGKA
jgi:release factor glutamine methyltransferase